MSEPKIAKEVAEAEFVRMCEARDLDVDTSTLDKEDNVRLTEIRSKVVAAIMSGKILVEEDGTVVLQLKRPTDKTGPALKFARPNGKTLAALTADKNKSKTEAAYAAAGHMANVPTVALEELDYHADGKFIVSLVGLFLG